MSNGCDFAKLSRILFYALILLPFGQLSAADPSPCPGITLPAKPTCTAPNVPTPWLLPDPTGGSACSQTLGQCQVGWLCMPEPKPGVYIYALTNPGQPGLIQGGPTYEWTWVVSGWFVDCTPNSAGTLTNCIYCENYGCGPGQAHGLYGATCYNCGGPNNPNPRDCPLVGEEDPLPPSFVWLDYMIKCSCSKLTKAAAADTPP